MPLYRRRGKWWYYYAPVAIALLAGVTIASFETSTGAERVVVPLFALIGVAIGAFLSRALHRSLPLRPPDSQPESDSSHPSS